MPVMVLAEQKNACATAAPVELLAAGAKAEPAVSLASVLRSLRNSGRAVPHAPHPLFAPALYSRHARSARIGAQALTEPPVSRQSLMEAVWGYHPGVTPYTLETHIYRLRQKMERDPVNWSLLITTEGGYRLKAA